LLFVDSDQTAAAKLHTVDSCSPSLTLVGWNADETGADYTADKEVYFDWSRINLTTTNYSFMRKDQPYRIGSL